MGMELISVEKERMPRMRNHVSTKVMGAQKTNTRKPNTTNGKYNKQLYSSSVPFQIR